MSIFPANTSGNVIFIDLGLHKEALQTSKMLEWFGRGQGLIVYGFEANPVYFECASRLFENRPNVELINAAVVGPDHIGATVDLFLDGSAGLGDSLFAKRGSGLTVKVPAIKLSEFIKARRLDQAGKPIILRMNIEGAELFVLQDLIDAGMTSVVSGWYGLWNDCAKIDPKLDRDLQQAKVASGIENFTFNDRDSRGRYARFREAVIRYDLATSIMPVCRR